MNTADKHIITIEHSPYFPDVRPWDFFLFSVKSVLKGLHFESNDWVKKKTEEF